MKTITKLFLLLLLAVGLSSVELQAQQSSEDEYIDTIRDMVKSEAFNISSLIQARGIFDFDDETGTRAFSVPQARLKVNGELDGGFSYNLHFDAADNFILLDAIIGYKVHEKANVTVGAQKPGISYEFLTGPHKIDFVSRSFVVAALTQNRDLGAKLSGNLSEEFNYSVGIFNGNRLSGNDNNKFYYAGRVEYTSAVNESGKLIAGVNAAYGEHSNALIGGGSLPAINGERIIYGGDIRFENRSLILATEVLAANLDYTGFNEQDKVFGYHLTGGYKISDKSRVLARIEQFSSDLLPAAERERLSVGYTHFPTSQTGFRINYLLPLDDSEFKNHGLALNYQISF